MERPKRKDGDVHQHERLRDERPLGDVVSGPGPLAAVVGGRGGGPVAEFSFDGLPGEDAGEECGLLRGFLAVRGEAEALAEAFLPVAGFDQLRLPELGQRVIE